MITEDNVLDFLEEKEFDKAELRTLLKDMRLSWMEFAANRAIRQFNECRGRFRDKRDLRLMNEGKNRVRTQINDSREVTKHDRAQVMYKNNRRKKKTNNNHKPTA
jgi:hypothetical protein